MTYKRLPTGTVVTEKEYKRLKRSKKMKAERTTAMINAFMTAAKEKLGGK